MTSKKQCTTFEQSQETTTLNNNNNNEIINKKMNNNNEKKNLIVKKFKKFPAENISEAASKAEDKLLEADKQKQKRNSFDLNAKNNENKKIKQPNIQLRCNAVNQQSEQNKATLLLVTTVLVIIGLY